MEYLFVYGTLLSDIPSSMSKFLRRRADLVGKATTKGRLLDLGGYPGFISGGDRVTGELYRIQPDRAEETWEMLDAYESVTGSSQDEYVRESVEAQVSGGGTFTATTYSYIGPTKGKTIIPNGNYPPYYRNNPEHQKFTGH